MNDYVVEMRFREGEGFGENPNIKMIIEKNVCSALIYTKSINWIFVPFRSLSPVNNLFRLYHQYNGKLFVHSLMLRIIQEAQRKLMVLDTHDLGCMRRYC